MIFYRNIINSIAQKQIYNVASKSFLFPGATIQFSQLSTNSVDSKQIKKSSSISSRLGIRKRLLKESGPKRPASA